MWGCVFRGIDYHFRHVLERLAQIVVTETVSFGEFCPFVPTELQRFVKSGDERDGLCRIEQKNKFSVGEKIEIMKPDGRNVDVTVKRIVNEEGQEQESAPHARQIVYVELDEKAERYDLLRRAEEADTFIP